MKKIVYQIKFYTSDDTLDQSDATSSIDVGGDRFLVKAIAWEQILNSYHYNFLPVVAMVMILVLLVSQC